MWRSGWPVLCWKFEGENSKNKQGDDCCTMQFIGDSWFLPNFDNFFSNSPNKNNLSQFLAQKLLLLHVDNSSLEFVITLNDNILTRVNDLLVKIDTNYCAPEEALTDSTCNQWSSHWLEKHLKFWFQRFGSFIFICQWIYRDRSEKHFYCTCKEKSTEEFDI